MKKITPKAISLFCGAGGCSLGFKRAGYEIIYASDIDKKAISTYQSNFHCSLAEQADINSIDFSLLLERLNINSGDLDILIGGPPCQGFSTAGPRFWDDPRNHLLRSYVEALRTIRPKWFLMENVEGLLTSNNGIYILEAAKAFIELGYLIRIEKVYAQEFGIPQRRKRVIILGNRLGKSFAFPDPVSPATGRIFRKSGTSLAQAIDDLPKASPQAAEALHYERTAESHIAVRLRDGAEYVTDHHYVNAIGLQLKRISTLKPGETMKHLPDYLQHASFKNRANRRVADGTPSEKRGGAPSGLKRLLATEPSLTITSAAPREFVHPSEDRTLTIRECARIQTFPDTFMFIGSDSDKIRQIGNAIPPDLAYEFAAHIARSHGFDGDSQSEGGLLGLNLTKADAMSPALAHTHLLLQEVMNNRRIFQANLFEELHV
jgi:DNA (cytosine-5)-methyltransferase 1